MGRCGCKGTLEWRRQIIQGEYQGGIDSIRIWIMSYILKYYNLFGKNLWKLMRKNLAGAIRLKYAIISRIMCREGRRIICIKLQYVMMTGISWN